MPLGRRAAASTASIERSAPLAAVAQGEPPDVALASRPPIGMPKAGLRVDVQTRPQQWVYRGRANPALLYLVVGTALGLGFAGAVILSPERGVLGSLTFSVLFSPLILFVIYGALRLRSLCVLDRQRRVLRVKERSYFSSL